MLKIAVLGCGKIAERCTVPNLINLKGVATPVLCDKNISQALRLERIFKLDNPKIYTDYKAMIKQEKLDAVIINSPTFLHEEMALYAANAGLHIMIEKPIALTLASARRIIKSAEKNKVILMVEQSQRFDPVHQKAKALLDKGILGDITEVHGRIGHAGPQYWAKSSSWFYNKKLSGGGALMDLGIHIIDLLRWFSGKEVKEVSANLATLRKKLPVENNANVLLKFADNTLGSFVASWTSQPYTINTHLVGSRGRLYTFFDQPRRSIIFKEANLIMMDPNDERKEHVYRAKGSGSWEAATHHFVNCVRLKKKPIVDGIEGAKSLAVILAAYEAARKGRWVKVAKL